MRELNQDKSAIVQAYSVLDQITADTVTVSVTGADGVAQTFEASPEMIQGMKSGLTGSLFGKTQDWQSDLKFDSVDSIAQALDIEPTQLDGLVSTKSDHSFSSEDILPFLNRNHQQEQHAV